MTPLTLPISDAQAAYYPHLKRDADKAHAVFHGESCLCTQSLESMAQEVVEARDTLLAETRDANADYADVCELKDRLNAEVSRLREERDDARVLNREAGATLERVIQERDGLAAELLEVRNDVADLSELKDRLSASLERLSTALMELREASTDAYKTGRVDALAFVTAGNVLSEVRK